MSDQHPLIPLGTVGKLRETEYTVIGFLARSVTFDELDYFWTEYLLYQPRVGFRWLVHSDRHWSFVQPISAGAVRKSVGSATFDGRTFRLFQSALATVRHVLGEFYLKVTIGEEVMASDYISPPEMLSIEATVDPADGTVQKRTAAREVSYSLGIYVPHAEIEQAFGVSTLPRGFQIAPNQPSPIDRRVYVFWAAFAAFLIFVDVGISAAKSAPGVDQSFFIVALLLISVVPIGTLLYAHSFERSRWADSQFNPYDTGDDDDE
jgi:hypothetical protein